MNHFKNALGISPQTNIIKFLKSPYLLLVWLILCSLSYTFVDQHLATYLATHITTEEDHLAQFVTNFGVGGYYLAAGFIAAILMRFIFKNRIGFYRATILFVAVALSGIICNILKYVFGRSRPPLFLQDHIYGFHFFTFSSDANYWSFPSGHSTTISSAMVACTLLWPRWWPLFILAIVLVMLSRLVLLAHFLTDVMMGAYIGAITAIWVYNYFNKRFTKRTL